MKTAVVAVFLALLFVVNANMGCNHDRDCEDGERCHATVLNSGKRFTFCVDPKYHVKVSSFMEEKAQNIMANKVPAPFAELEAEKENSRGEAQLKEAMVGAGNDFKSVDTYKNDVIRSGAEVKDVKPVEQKPIVAAPVPVQIVNRPLDEIKPVQVEMPERDRTEFKSQPVIVKHAYARTESYDDEDLNDIEDDLETDDEDMNDIEDELDLDENDLDDDDLSEIDDDLEDDLSEDLE